MSGINIGGAGIGAGGNLTGFNLGGLGLGAGGKVSGINIGGLGIGAAEDISGFSVSIIGIGAGGKIRGITAAGIGIGGGDEIQGLAIAGLGIGSETIKGIAVAPAVGAINLKGIILAPAYLRVGSDNHQETQDGEVIESSEGTMSGVAVSAYNRIKGDQKGVAIGIVNYTRRIKGFQLGVINIVKENPKGLRVLPFFNTRFYRKP